MSPFLQIQSLSFSFSGNLYTFCTGFHLFWLSPLFSNCELFLTLPVHLRRARRSWFFPSVGTEEKRDGMKNCIYIQAHVRSVYKRVPLTVHKSLQALYEVFDGIWQVPRVLLDVLVYKVTAANCPVVRLAKLCSQKNPRDAWVCASDTDKRAHRVTSALVPGWLWSE